MAADGGCGCRMLLCSPASPLEFLVVEKLDAEVIESAGVNGVTSCCVYARTGTLRPAPAGCLLSLHCSALLRVGSREVERQAAKQALKKRLAEQ